MRTILITGGVGFIGSHTCVELLEKGFDICILDSLANSSIKILSQIKKIIDLSKNSNVGKLFFRDGDLRNISFIEEIFLEFENKKMPFDFVIHFAGFKAVQESVINPLIYWENNIISTINLLKIMHKFNCHKLVFSSSATIYDQIKDGKFVEDSPKKPLNPYGNTKLTIENMLYDLFNSDRHKWKIANLRYFNPVGAHNSGLIGENPILKPTNLFPLIIKVSKKEINKLSIFGKDWPTKDGTCIRDYIHVMDLADAHIAALDFLNINPPQLISFNIGTGKGTSVLEVIEKFSKVNMISLPYKFESRREGDSARLVADNKFALEILDWRPKRSIEDMCADSYRWSKFVSKI